MIVKICICCHTRIYCFINITSISDHSNVLDVFVYLSSAPVNGCPIKMHERTRSLWHEDFTVRWTKRQVVKITADRRMTTGFNQALWKHRPNLKWEIRDISSVFLGDLVRSLRKNIFKFPWLVASLNKTKMQVAGGRVQQRDIDPRILSTSREPALLANDVMEGDS